MPIDITRLHQAVDDLYGNMPHPQAPRIKVKEYAAFERAAKVKKSKGHGQEAQVTGQEVSDMHAHLHALEMSPQEFESSWRVARPLASRLLGRDPEMDELKYLAGKHPEDVSHFYNSMPHPQYPEVTAGQMAKFHYIAEPFAREHAGRKPVPLEVARFAMQNASDEHIRNHYQS